ncbi:MAG TPA: hypothetical protein VMH83_11110 [Candidatus Acidoferrum sp.]|nr:hypothetical protein [Candidatus Acidoferrum sp.]
MFRPTFRTLATATALAAAMLAVGACSKAPEPKTEAAAPAAPAAPVCDRACLIGVAQSYVAAIVAHDPSKAPLAANVAFVENVTKKKPGEGLWQDAVKAPSTFAITVPDETNETVGYLAMMTRMAPPQAPQGASPAQIAEAAKGAPTEQPVMVAFRLKLDASGKIAEAEHLLTGVREGQLANLQTPREGIFTELAADQRLPHDKLIAIGKTYYDALDDNNGELAPFAPDCERHENGMITASGNPAPNRPAIPGTAPPPANVAPVARDCKGQMNSGTFQYIDRIENRRVFAADPQTGLVMGLSHFRHPMTNLPYKVKHVDGSETETTKATMAFAPFDLPAAHIFKVGADGQMHEIEAMGFTTGYNSPTGWEQ